MYGIKKLILPSFINLTEIPGMGAELASGIILELRNYAGIHLSSSTTADADGILLGIVSSGDVNVPDRIAFMKGALSQHASQTLFTGDIQELQDYTPLRPPFYHPSTIAARLKLELILIRNTKMNISLLTRPDQLGEFIKENHPEIIWRQSLYVEKANGLVLYGKNANGVFAGAFVNETQNAGILRKLKSDLNLQIREQFRHLVLYAF